MQVNMPEASTQLSRLVQAALAGEDVVIASQGQPQVRLVPCNKSRGLRHPGALRDRFGKATEQVDAAFSDGTEAEVRAALQGLIG